MEGREHDKETKTDEIPFNKQLRLATREIHATSDALVNAKLAFVLSDSSVWAEGLLIFYEIFRFLEGAMARLRGTPVYELYIEGMERTEAFEKDLEFYLGANWNKDYIPRESVTKYLMHLQQLERDEPVRLMAYVYHLYMGLFSGGQILRKKRAIWNTLSFSRFSRNAKEKDETDTAAPKCGDHVTDFGDTPIFRLKKQMADALNRAAESLDAKTKEALIEESKMVFVLNNSIIRTVHGANEVLLRRALKIAIGLVSVMILYFVFYSTD